MIVLQTPLPAKRFLDVYTVPAVQGNAVCVELYLCNQSPAHWAVLDVVVVKPGHRRDKQVWESGETSPSLVAPADYFLYRGYDAKPTETLRVEANLHTGETVRVRASSGDVTCTVLSEEFVTPDALHALEERVDVLVEDVLRIQQQEEDVGVAAVTAGTDRQRAANRTDTKLVRFALFDTENELVNGTGTQDSFVISLENATKVESLMLEAASATGAADVKAEFRTSWDGSFWDSYADTTDIVSSTNTERPNNPEGMNAYAVAAPLNRFIQIRVTGVGANPADTRVRGWLIVREGYAT